MIEPSIEVGHRLQRVDRGPPRTGATHDEHCGAASLRLRSPAARSIDPSLGPDRLRVIVGKEQSRPTHRATTSTAPHRSGRSLHAGQHGSGARTRYTVNTRPQSEHASYYFRSTDRRHVGQRESALFRRRIPAAPTRRSSVGLADSASRSETNSSHRRSVTSTATASLEIVQCDDKVYAWHANGSRNASTAMATPRRGSVLFARERQAGGFVSHPRSGADAISSPGLEIIAGVARHQAGLTSSSTTAACSPGWPRTPRTPSAPAWWRATSTATA